MGMAVIQSPVLKHVDMSTSVSTDIGGVVDLVSF